MKTIMKHRILLFFLSVSMSVPVYSINFARFVQLKSLAARAAHVTCSYVKEHKLASGAVATAALLALLPSARRMAVAGWKQGATLVKSAASTFMRWWKPVCKDAPQVSPTSAQENVVPVGSILQDENLEALDAEGLTPLHRAIENGDTAKVEDLLARGANINGVCQGLSPLFRAVRAHNVQIVEILCDKGADKNLCSTMASDKTVPGNTVIYTMTPLHFAIEADEYWATLANRVDIINLLYEDDAAYCVCKIMSGNEEVKSESLAPLELAIIRGYADVVRLLCQKGAVRQSTRVPLLHTAIELVSKRRVDFEVFSILFQYGADIEAVYEGMTPLQKAKRLNMTDVVDLFIQSGAQWTGMDQAFIDEKLQALQRLQMAIDKQYVEGVQESLKYHHAPISIEMVWNALATYEFKLPEQPQEHPLDAQLDAQIPGLLIKRFKPRRAAHIRKRETQQTLLHLAAEKGNLPVVRSLLEDGYSKNVFEKDCNGRVPRDVARLPAVKNLLVDYMERALKTT